jgi:hypothetical protein
LGSDDHIEGEMCYPLGDTSAFGLSKMMMGGWIGTPCHWLLMGPSPSYWHLHIEIEEDERRFAGFMIFSVRIVILGSRIFLCWMMVMVVTVVDCVLM